ncbi:MAG: hypothetical protein ACE37H_13675 [Phycisphaeraceae bacterium]
MSKKLLTLLFPALALAFAPAMLTGCEEETEVEEKAEEGAEKVEEGAEKAGDKIKEGAEKVEEGVEDLTN